MLPSSSEKTGVNDFLQWNNFTVYKFNPHYVAVIVDGIGYLPFPSPEVSLGTKQFAEFVHLKNIGF